MIRLIIGNRQQVIAAGEILWDQAQRFRVGDNLCKVDRFLADSPRHDVADRGFGDESQTDQQAAKRDVAVTLFGKDDG